MKQKLDLVTHKKNFDQALGNIQNFWLCWLRGAELQRELDEKEIGELKKRILDLECKLRQTDQEYWRKK